MDHPCYKCGQSVEDGKPFCLQCGAPQIRVATPEATTPAATGSISSPDLHAFSLDPPHIPGAFHAPAIWTDIEWRRAFWLCAAAALISVVSMSLRLIGPLLAVMGGGLLAVLLYYRRNPTATPSAASGAKIGAVTGLLSSAVSGFIFAIFVAVMQAGGEVRQQMMEDLQQFVSRTNDPQVQAAFDLLKTPGGLTKMTMDMVGLFLLSIAAGSLAGALAGAFLGRRKRP